MVLGTTVVLGVLALAALGLPGARADTASVRFSGFYDNHLINYEATVEVTDSPTAAQQIALGNVVFHMVDAKGDVPAVQCARLLAAFPNLGTDCNTLNFIPTDIGYSGGAWNLQIFHWKKGMTPVELSSDVDIAAAVQAGWGTLEVTNILVRCPVVDFSSLR